MIKITNLNNRKNMDWKKWTEPKKPVGKYQNIFVIKVPGGEKEDEAGKVFEEIMAEISSNLTKKTHPKKPLT